MNGIFLFIPHFRKTLHTVRAGVLNDHTQAHASKIRSKTNHQDQDPFKSKTTWSRDGAEWMEACLL